MILEFTVPGIPVPQGSKRHVGGGRMIEANANLRPWRDSVTYAAREALGDQEMMTGAVRVVLEFTFVRPKSSKRLDHTVKPDLDKLIRSIFDGLTAAGVWHDDAQAVSVFATKRYANQPGVRVAVKS